MGKGKGVRKGHGGFEGRGREKRKGKWPGTKFVQGRDVNKARGVKAKAENAKVNISCKCQS